jgi:hypothetical protein
MDAIVTKCLHCDEPVPEMVGRGRKKQFCCEAHRKAHSRINGQKAPAQYYVQNPPTATLNPLISLSAFVRKFGPIPPRGSVSTNAPGNSLGEASPRES